MKKSEKRVRRLFAGENVTFVIPTLNETKSIGGVIKECENAGSGSSMIIVDGGSTDGTLDEARKTLAKTRIKAKTKILTQRGKGKGSAMLEAAPYAKTSWIVFIDGDGTYAPDEAVKAIQTAGDAELLVGSRFKGRLQENSLTKINYAGNVLLNSLASFLFNHQTTDLLSGLRCVKKKSLERLDLRCNGFEIETEMSLKAIKNKMKIKEFPATYRQRANKTKLSPLKDGTKILLQIIREKITNS